MSNDDIHELAASYALDALDADERTRFEAHLAACGECTQAVDDFAAVAAELAEDLATPPPAALKGRVFAEIADTPQLPPLAAAPSNGTPTRGVPAKWLAAAAALIVLGGVGIGLWPEGRVDVPDAADAVVTALAPLADDTAGSIEVVWSDSLDQVLVTGADLGDPGAGKVYALWFLLDDGVAPAGLFEVDQGQANVTLDVADVQGQGWGITIEPAAGSPQPTTDVLFAGEF